MREAKAWGVYRQQVEEAQAEIYWALRAPEWIPPMLCGIDRQFLADCGIRWEE